MILNKNSEPKTHSFCKNSASESWGDGVELAWFCSVEELWNLDWKIDVPDICPLDLYSSPFPPNPETAAAEKSDELGCWEGAACCVWVPSSSTGLSESELLPPRLPHLRWFYFTFE